MHFAFFELPDLGDNYISVNVLFSKKQFPKLLDLYLNGNRILIFPDESLKSSLEYLGI